MGQRSRNVEAKDAQIKLSKEECAIGMGQRPNDAAVNGVQTMLNKEECVAGMGQVASDAAAKDVHITLSVEECAKDMGKSEKQFSSEGWCPNQSQKGGTCVGDKGNFCILCSTGGCTTNQVQVKLSSKEEFASD
ncbi:hypothetical protein QTG54_005590 [Skeletonema marinoi]|uniref:Uncharacterized protein n=1 Tax=Skeletonema marinoi TaxID=267567 RepID=A0AAD8YD18_9STRA|nr:hypothetical protein QTG54_005590 [Skeletonema marinoi]